jgi:hypothetical protein
MASALRWSRARGPGQNGEMGYDNFHEKVVGKRGSTCRIYFSRTSGGLWPVTPKTQTSFPILSWQPISSIPLSEVFALFQTMLLMLLGSCRRWHNDKLCIVAPPLPGCGVEGCARPGKLKTDNDCLPRWFQLPHVSKPISHSPVENIPLCLKTVYASRLKNRMIALEKFPSNTKAPLYIILLSPLPIFVRRHQVAHLNQPSNRTVLHPSLVLLVATVMVPILMKGGHGDLLHDMTSISKPS